MNCAVLRLQQVNPAKHVLGLLNKNQMWWICVKNQNDFSHHLIHVSGQSKPGSEMVF